MTSPIKLVARRRAIALTLARMIAAPGLATLFEIAGKLPGARVLDGRWGVERHAIAIPSGREAGHEFLRIFTSEIISSGLVRGAIGRAELKGALDP